MTDSTQSIRKKKRKYDSISESLDARKAQDRERVTSRINIGETITEWLEIKEVLGCQTHDAVAKCLINR